jgi:hypothetical protein
LRAQVDSHCENDAPSVAAVSPAAIPHRVVFPHFEDLLDQDE